MEGTANPCRHPELAIADIVKNDGVWRHISVDGTFDDWRKFVEIPKSPTVRRMVCGDLWWMSGYVECICDSERP